MKTQQNKLDKVSKALSDAESLISDLENRVSEKDNTIIELYSLREKDQENNKCKMDELDHALNENNQELQKRDEKLHHMTEELESLKGELEKYKLSTEEMEKYLEQVQRMNANEVERIRKEHQEELEAVNSKHVAELEDLKLLTNKQLEKAGREMEKRRQVYDSEVHDLKESLGEQATTNNDLKQQMATLKEHYDNTVACLRETNATLERVQFGLKEQEASHVNEISFLRSELKGKGEQIADLEDKIASEEEKNLNITNKLTEERKKLVNEHESLVGAHNVLEQKIASLNENLSAVTDERDSLFNEVKLLRNTHKVIEQSMDRLKKSSCLVSNKFNGESSLVEDSVERLEVRQNAGFTEGTVLWVKGRVHLQLNISPLARTNILKTLACKKTKSKFRTPSTSN